MKTTFRKRKNGLPIILVMLFSIFCTPAFSEITANPKNNFCFKPGEKLSYKLCWGLIPAGFAELSVEPPKELDGETALHFLLTIRTNSFMDHIYKVRDRIESFTDLELDNSLLYIKNQHEGKTIRNISVNFDLENHTATHINSWEKREPIPISEKTLDPLASLFYVRNQPLSEGLEITRPVTDGKKNVLGVARVIKREKIQVGDIEYDTFVVEPDLKDVRGVFEKSDKSKLTLWISADDRRQVVKIKSKVVVGSFTGTLIN